MCVRHICTTVAHTHGVHYKLLQSASTTRRQIYTASAYNGQAHRLWTGQTRRWIYDRHASDCSSTAVIGSRSVGPSEVSSDGGTAGASAEAVRQRRCQSDSRHRTETAAPSRSSAALQTDACRWNRRPRHHHHLLCTKFTATKRKRTCLRGSVRVTIAATNSSGAVVLNPARCVAECRNSPENLASFLCLV